MSNLSTLQSEVIQQLSPALRQSLQRRREQAAIDWRAALDSLPLYMQREVRYWSRLTRVSCEELMTRGGAEATHD